MRISDWSSDVCSSDLEEAQRRRVRFQGGQPDQAVVVRADLRGQEFDGEAGVRRSPCSGAGPIAQDRDRQEALGLLKCLVEAGIDTILDRKSTRMNSSH